MELAMNVFGVLTILALLLVGAKLIYELIKRSRESAQLETEFTLQAKEKKAVFQKYYGRMCLGGILKAAVFGLIVGLACNTVAGLIAWYVGYENWMLLVATGLGIALNAGCIAYFVRFQPDITAIAKRVDRLGLDERLVTMLYLANDDSYIAQRQRADATRRVEEVSQKLLKIRVSKVMRIVAAITAVACIASTSLVALAAEDFIPSGEELVETEIKENFVAVTYFVEDGGEIVGETDQLIAPGGDAEPVTAVALDGWMFMGWDDGLDTPDRTDTSITVDTLIVAIFQQLEEQEGEGEDEGKEPMDGSDAEGDEANDIPSEDAGEKAEESEQPGQGDGQGDQDGEGEGESDGNSGSGDQQGDGQGQGKGEGAGGRWEEFNQFLDGNTYYQDKIELYKEIAMEYLTSGEEIPDEIREFIEKYYEGLI